MIAKQKNELDQFYTNPNIAKYCYELLCKKIDIKKYNLILEPSAGSGSFYNLLPDNKVGLDLDPKADGIIKQDFFTFEPEKEKSYLVIGNPPFGRVASLAIKFFNKSAQFSEVIAFVVPKTFNKKSVHNKLDLNFKLFYTEDLPKKSFLLNGEEYDVPCCFQIWIKSSKKRIIKKVNMNNELFDFVKKQDADIAVRRVGGRAGKSTIDVSDTSETSHYYLKLKTNKIKKEQVVEIINNFNFKKTVNATVGVKSLSMPEFFNRLKISKLKEYL